jgi:hypothetical protein
LLLAPVKRELVQIDTPANVEARPGQTFEVEIKFFVADGYHINSNKPTEEYMIPTRIEWQPSPLKHVSDAFPPADMVAFKFSNGKKLSVYEGGRSIKAKFTVPASGVSGKVDVDGIFKYQACDHQACYPPAKVEIRIPVRIL